MIYLAAPYSHPEKAIMHARFVTITQYCASCMVEGELIFSPITYGHPFAVAGLAKTDHMSWWKFNKYMMDTAFSVRVLRIPGWATSKGVTAEIGYCQEHNIPLEFVSL